MNIHFVEELQECNLVLHFDQLILTKRKNSLFIRQLLFRVTFQNIYPVLTVYRPHISNYFKLSIIYYNRLLKLGFHHHNFSKIFFRHHIFKNKFEGIHNFLSYMYIFQILLYTRYTGMLICKPCNKMYIFSICLFGNMADNRILFNNFVVHKLHF